MTKNKAGFEMMNDGRRIGESSVRHQHPDWSAGELKAAVFERIYRDDFSADEMTEIKVWFRSHV